MAMKGTMREVTWPMRLTPPSTTMATMTARMTPVTRGSRPSRPFMAPAISLLWAMLPMPKLARPPSTAKMQASHFQFLPRPFSM